MEMAKHEYEIGSNDEEHSSWSTKFKFASRSKQATDVECGVITKTTKNVVLEFEGTSVMSHRAGGTGRISIEKSSYSKCLVTKHLEGCPGIKNAGSPRKAKYKAGALEIERLRQRLKHLEEEMATTKVNFFQMVKERAELVNEINQKFQYRQQPFSFSCSSQKLIEQQVHDGAMIVSSPKNEKAMAGLSEILREDSNPSLISGRRQLLSSSIRLACVEIEQIRDH